MRYCMFTDCGRKATVGMYCKACHAFLERYTKAPLIESKGVKGK